MAEVFGRSYELWVTPSRQLVRVSEVTGRVGSEVVANSEDYDGLSTKFKDAVDWLATPVSDLKSDALLDTLVIRNLHIVADVTYKKEASSSLDQEATIEVYNLSEASQAKIQDESIIILRAGYEQDKVLPLIFSGQIVKSYTEKRGEDVVTKIHCRDTYVLIKDHTISLSFAPEEFTNRKILRGLLAKANDLGIATSLANLPKEDSETELGVKLNRLSFQGYVVEGNLFDQINSFCEQIGLVAYIHLSILYVEPKAHHPKEMVDVTKIYRDNVIGIVSPLNDSTTSGVGSKKAPNSITLKTFLLGTARLADYVQLVDHPKFKGYYETSSVKHTLAYEGADWCTTIEARELTSAE